MADEVTTRSVERDEVTPEFIERVEGLLDRAFDGWPRLDLPVSTADHLRWKMSGAPPELPVAIVAELDGRLASYRTLLARQVLIRGEQRLFLHFVDAAVEPELQGRGVNRAMQELMQREFHARFDISIDDSTNDTIRRGRTRLGAIHEFGNPVQPYVRLLDWQRFLRTGSAVGLPVRVARLLFRSAVSALARLASRSDGGGRANYSIRTVQAFDERIDAFCAKATAQFDLVPQRTAEFLNWRYADARGGQFTIRIAELEGRLLGYVVTKPGEEMTKVADLLVAPGETSVAGALIADAVGAAREAGSEAITCWFPRRHPYRAALHAAGLVALGRETSLVYRAVSMTDEELAFLREPGTSMHLTEGDTDFI